VDQILRHLQNPSWWLITITTLSVAIVASLMAGYLRDGLSRGGSFLASRYGGERINQLAQDETLLVIEFVRVLALLVIFTAVSLTYTMIVILGLLIHDYPPTARFTFEVRALTLLLGVLAAVVGFGASSRARLVQRAHAAYRQRKRTAAALQR
jgi:hypothetical protein